jgi:hypothetical protein
MEGRAVSHNFERDPPKDHHCQVWLNLVPRFQRKSYDNNSSPLKPLNQIKPNLAGMVLGRVPFTIMYDSPALHSRWLLRIYVKTTPCHVAAVKIGAHFDLY